jgi:hypothetical protein
MKVKYPNYLQDKVDDDDQLKIFKQAGRNEADNLCKTGVDSKHLGTIRIVTELGDDMNAPLFMSPSVSMQPECRYLADIRFLIERYEDGYNLSLWRERLVAFNKHQDDIATSPLITKALIFQKNQKKGHRSARVKHIHDLVNTNKNLSAKELMQIADINVIGKMSVGTFSNHVSNAKNSEYI